MAVFDPKAWVLHLEAHQVEYVLVGGVAGNLYGATRPTTDIDVVPRWSRDNLERLCDALRAAGAKPTTGPALAAEDITPEILIEREIMTWHTDLGRIDTLVGIPDAEGMPVDFRQLSGRALQLRLGDSEVAVASLDDVITSKEFASRAKDRMALPELYRLRDTQHREPPTAGLDLD